MEDLIFMNKYACAAINAANLCKNGADLSPNEAWEKATIALFGEGSSAQKKGCPKGAFLGLCEEGLIKGVTKGDYTGSKKNKRYALKAVSVLKRDPALVSEIDTLWSQVMGGLVKVHNAQMDVVVALWNAELLNLGESATDSK